MVTGVIFTALGVGAAIGSAVHFAAPYEAVIDLGYGRGNIVRAAHDEGTTIVLGLLGATFLAIGIPLWASGARSPRPEDDRAPKADVKKSAEGVELSVRPDGGALRGRF
jgi:hypothetical protein